jgi:hypothetical protein
MKAFIVLLIGILLLFSACEIHKPSLPVWDIELAIPLVNELYYVSDLVDSVNIIVGENDLVYLTGSGEVDTPDIGRVALSPNINESGIPIPSGVNQDIDLPFYDSADNALLTYGELASGSIRIRFNNVATETQMLRVSIADITSSNGNPLTMTYDGSDEWQIIDLAGYHFGVYNSMQDLSSLDANLQTSSSLPDGTILGTMDIMLNDELEFSVFQGRLNHLEVGLNSSSASIDIDYPNDIDQAITLSDASLQLDVINYMGFHCEFEGFFEARRGEVVERIQIVDANGNNFQIAPADATGPGFSSLAFDNNISALMQIMPEHIEIVDAKFTVDSQSGYGTLRQEDRIRANYTVNAPFRFMLHEHTITVEEAVKINISQDNRDYISNDLLEAGLEMQALNRIPIGGWARAYFGDTPDIDTTDPETYLFSKQLELHSSETHPDWQDLERLTLSRSELELFTQAEIYLKWEFSFEESQSLVEVYAGSGDYIAVRSMLHGKVRINTERN